MVPARRAPRCGCQARRFRENRARRFLRAAGLAPTVEAGIERGTVPGWQGGVSYSWSAPGARLNAKCPRWRLGAGLAIWSPAPRGARLNAEHSTCIESVELSCAHVPSLYHLANLAKLDMGRRFALPPGTCLTASAVLGKHPSSEERPQVVATVDATAAPQDSGFCFCAELRHQQRE